MADLQTDLAAGDADVYVASDLSDSGSTLVVGQPSSTNTSGFTTLHLGAADGTPHDLVVRAIELTSSVAGTPTGAKLVVVGPGTLTVSQSSTGTPAVEVSSGSTLEISGGTVTASVPASSTAAAIGGGPAMGSGPQNAGTIVIDGRARVTANGGDRGAAIGGGYGGSANVAVDDSAVVTANVSGGAAAIGAGYGSGSSTVVLRHSARVEAHQNGTGATGAAVGGGASPTAQIAGTVTLGDEAALTATSAGAGAAIGGGYHGDGGTIGASGYSSVSATGAQAAIGDGEHSTGPGSAISFSGLGVQVNAHGGTGSAGGAGVGGGSTSYGNDSLTVDGGATLAASSDNGPAIGGLGNTASMTVGIGNARVTATGGPSSAAIGAGSASSVGAGLTIGSGGTVVVSAGGSAIGGATADRFGSLSNAGSLTLQSGGSLTIPTGASATNSGSFSNDGTVTVNGTLTNSGGIANAGRLTGSGSLSNSGAVVQSGSLDVPVSGSAFEIVYDSQGGAVAPGTQLVYADSLRAAQLALPAATPPSAGSFSGWNTSADGTGTGLDASSSLGSVAGGSASGAPFRFRVYALYQLTPVLPSTTALGQAVVGTGYSASIAATAGTAPITYSYTGDLPAGLTLDTAKGTISGTPTTAGTFTMHLTARNNAGSATHDYTIQVVPTVLHVSAPAVPRKNARYLAGAKLDVQLSGFQANESYTITIGGRTVSTGKAPTNAAFTVRVAVPRTIGEGARTVRVSGSGHLAGASSSILTASAGKKLVLKASVKKPKAKKRLVLTASKLYPGESVRIVIAGKHKQTATGAASASGAFRITVKKGLAKGGYTVTVTGAGSARTAHIKLTVK